MDYGLNLISDIEVDCGLFAFFISKRVKTYIRLLLRLFHAHYLYVLYKRDCVELSGQQNNTGSLAWKII